MGWPGDPGEHPLARPAYGNSRSCEVITLAVDPVIFENSPGKATLASAAAALTR